MDVDLVVKLQEDIFWQQAGQRVYLTASGLPKVELLNLAATLRHFVELQWLHVEGSGICQEVSAALAASLASLRKLSEFRINKCSISPEAAAVLTEGLLQCVRLASVDLSCNALVDAGVAAIAAAILQSKSPPPPTFSSIVLAPNMLGSEGYEALDALRRHGLKVPDSSAQQC